MRCRRDAQVLFITATDRAGWAVDDDAAAVAAVKHYLSFFQGRLDDWECADQDELRDVGERKALGREEQAHGVTRKELAAEKAKQKGIDTAAGITRQPPGRPPEGHQWDERLADWVPRPDPPAPELPLAVITAAMTSASVSDTSASPCAPASSTRLTG